MSDIEVHAATGIDSQGEQGEPVPSPLAESKLPQADAHVVKPEPKSEPDDKSDDKSDFSEEMDVDPQAPDLDDEEYDAGDAGNDADSVFSSDLSSDAHAEADSESDDSDGGQPGGRRREMTRKKAEAAAKKPPPPPREETLMTKKLRSAAPPAPPEPSKSTRTSAGGKSTASGNASTSRGAERIKRESNRDSDDGDEDEEMDNADDDASGSESGSQSDGLDLDGQPVVLERIVSEDKAKTDMEEIKGMWEWAAICEFLYLFRNYLELNSMFSMESLADALVRSPGPGIVADLHIELLNGVSNNKKNFTEDTWAAILSNRLAYERMRLVDKSSPFKPAKREEALEYAALGVRERVLVLKELCDIRLDRDDMKDVIEEAIKVAAPPKVEKKKAPPPPPPVGHRRSNRAATTLITANSVINAAATQAKKSKSSTFTIEDFRKEPLGADSSDCTYWFLDMWDVGAEEGGVNYGTVLFKEHPAPIKGGASKASASERTPPPKKKGRLNAAQQKYERLKAYRVPEPTGDCAERGSWQQLACSVSELEEVGFKLRRSKKKPDQTTATTILDQVVPSLHERHEMEERLKKARERTAKLLGNSGGGYWGQMEYAGRTMRQRKPVSYNTDDYDKTIRRAIRAAENEEPRDSRPPSAPAADGRRGRSRTDAVSAELPEPSRPGRSKPTKRYADSSSDDDDAGGDEDGGDDPMDHGGDGDGDGRDDTDVARKGEGRVEHPVDEDDGNGDGGIDKDVAIKGKGRVEHPADEDDGNGDGDIDKGGDHHEDLGDRGGDDSMGDDGEAAKEQAVSGGTQPGAATKNGGPVKVASEKLQPGPVGEVLPPQGAADGGGEAEQKLGNGCNKLGNAEHANGSTKALQGGGDEEVPYAATLEAVQCTSQPSQLIQRPIGAKREPQVVIAEAPATVAEAHTVQTEAPVIVAEGPQL